MKILKDYVPKCLRQNILMDPFWRCAKIFLLDLLLCKKYVLVALCKKYTFGHAVQRIRLGRNVQKIHFWSRCANAIPCWGPTAGWSWIQSLAFQLLSATPQNCEIDTTQLLYWYGKNVILTWQNAKSKTQHSLNFSTWNTKWFWFDKMIFFPPGLLNAKVQLSNRWAIPALFCISGALNCS